MVHHVTTTVWCWAGQEHWFVANPSATTSSCSNDFESADSRLSCCFMFVNDSSSIPLFLMLPSFSHHFSIIFPHVSHIFPQFVINYPSLFQMLKHRGTASDAPVESTSWHPQPSPFRSEGCSPARSSGCLMRNGLRTHQQMRWPETRKHGLISLDFTSNIAGEAS